jgi:protein-S-isoprenylcysteine O-methyltransferase Ste14
MDRSRVGTPNPLRVALVYALAIAVFGVALPAGVLELGGSLDRLLRLSAIPGGWVRAAFGAAGVAYGVAWVAWTNWALVRLGRGYPQEAFRRELLPATQKLVVTGPFRRTRNPMVFGVLAALEGLSLAVGSLAALLIVVPAAGLAMASYLRRWEEPGLVERFGAEYERYREQVPLIVPRLGRPR